MTCVPFVIDHTGCAEWDVLTPDQQDRVEELAWGALRVLTGGRVGHCEVLLRPCLARCLRTSPVWPESNYLYGPPLNPYVYGGQWYNACTCRGRDCSCGPLCEVVLPGEVAVVSEVRLDGALVLPTDYRLDGNRLLRTDGGCWPECQDLTQDVDKPGTFGVLYTPGVDPGLAGVYAAGVLACEFAKAETGGRCRLPAGVTMLSRQGVTFEVSSVMFPGGRTNIAEVDAYVFTVNPNGLQQPPRVWSPDLRRGRQTTP